MALIVEDGTRVADANSYVSVEFADQYHITAASTGWTGNTAVKEAALAVACQSLDLLYGPKYRSAPLEGTQSLLWPRYSFWDRYNRLRQQNSIPVELKNAQCELALMYLQGVNLFPEENQNTGLAAESVTVGEITTSKTYRVQPTKESFPGFRKIDLLVHPLLRKQTGSLMMSR